MSDGASFDISTESHAEWQLVRITGELDLSTAPLLSQSCADGSGRPIALHLGEVGFIDSSGLEAVAELARGTQRLVLVEPSGVVRRLIGLTGKTDAFDIVESIDDLTSSDISP